MTIILFFVLSAFGATPSEIKPLIEEIRTNGKAFSDLKELTSIGHRLSGSANAAKAVEWGKKKMESYGFDRVWLEEVKVPHWERGNHESVTLKYDGRSEVLKVAALGNSVGTSDSGVEAEVVEVQSLKEVDSKVAGKIVFYNRAMDPNLEDTFEAYGKAVDQRTQGATKAMQFGAAGVVIRSLTTLTDDDHPHTGVMHYDENATNRIPAGALSTHGANLLSAALRVYPSLKLNLRLSAKTYPDAPSYNVIGEITGRELPKKYVLVGGHLDSWDLATGAQDDGAGVVQSIEVLRAIKKLGLKPRRSVRAVLFMCEEFGGIGADQYAEHAKSEDEEVVAAMESDRGGFMPLGFSFGENVSDAFMQKIQSWSDLLSITHVTKFTRNGSGTDVEPLANLGAATMEIVPESRHYFDFHHSALDTIQAVNEKELLEGSASIATLAYLLADDVENAVLAKANRGHQPTRRLGWRKRP